MTTYQDYGKESFLHGVRDATSTENSKLKRAIWFIFVSTCAVILIYNTYSQVDKFLSYDHVTKLDILFEHTLDFAAVTVCNMNRYKRSAFTLQDIVVMGPHLQLVDEHYNLLHPEQYPQDWVYETFNNTDWETVEAASPDEDEYDMEDFDDRTGVLQEDIIQYCRWKSEVCSDTSWKLDYTHYGKCYTFNSGGNHTLLKAGSGNGLQVILNVQHDEYLSHDDSSDLGLKFLPHSPIEPPFLKELGFGLAPGYHYLVALQQRKIDALSEPYGQCVEDHVTDYFKNYTIPGCRIACETELIYNECGCRLIESPGNHPPCTVKQYDCAAAVLKSIEESDACVCENPCHSVQYPFRTSMLKLRQSTLDILRKEHPISDHLSLEDLVVLNIYFDSLSYELIEQLPAYTVLDILSDFGGNMGLWLGASILAAVQLVEFVSKLCLRVCLKCCSKAEGRTTVIKVAPADG